MIALIRKNLRLWGYGKSLALFAGCILFSISGRLNGCDKFYGKRRSYMSKPTTVLSVNGFEVTATFAENHNAAAVHHVKQILISSFAGKTTKLQSRDILVIPDAQRYNDNGRRYYVP